MKGKSQLPAALACHIERMKAVYNYDDTDPEQVAKVARRQQAFRDFVALCRKKQDATGRPTQILAC